MKSSSKSFKKIAGTFRRWKILTVLFCFIGAFAAAQSKKIKVACIGNSVTFGLTHVIPTESSYPRLLQHLLGENYSVQNFGHSGATLLRKGHNPYAKSKEFLEALVFAPDIAIIELGLNETDPRNWPNFGDEFVADYLWLIDTIRKTNPNVKIYLSLLTPIFHDHSRFLSGTRDWFWQIQALLPKIAKIANTELIDFHTALYSRPDLLQDAVHPNEEGAAILAKLAYQHISGDYGGLQLARPFQSHMVIQRHQPISFYGTADIGEKITISFNKLSKSIVANSNGQWLLVFPAMQAGGPYSATISTQNKKLELEDLLIGDVWLCSGQSNMAFPLKSAEHSPADKTSAEANSSIRLLQMNVLAETDNRSWDTAILRKINQLDYFSGSWQRCDSVKAKEFSAVGFFFGQQLQIELKVPIGLIQVAVGGSTTESWIDRYTLEHHPVLVGELRNWRSSDFFQPWVRERTNLNLKDATNSKQRHPYEPAYNFEAGISSLTRFPIKGVIWYQGESNAHNIELHEQLFPALVHSWRKKWGYEFPLYYVQLSSLNRPSWTLFRFNQLNFLKSISNTGMAVSSDVGDSLNVHPIRKKQVGQRLARLALHFTYGKKDIVPYGPMPLEARIEKQKIYIKFAHNDGLRAADGLVLRGFTLMDKKGNSHDVQARIEADQIIIPLENDTAVEVRYGWQPFTKANLVNGAGLPASTFKLSIQ